ncbi:vWA domain-containing protein [Clostridium tetani]|uniref:vWA domain-containing protein n=1 Tax=Clostridium tetani TaxID=1513 RepID=UPI0024A91831|nr:VWA-like domain-containing protein [Clostridium tetani]
MIKVNNKFETLKRELLKDAYNLEDKLIVDSEFRKKFFYLIELTTFSLMKGEDNFFGLFSMQMKREINTKILWPLGTTVSLSHFVLHFNPFLFLNCSLEEMKALIKHEIYHIMFGHFKRERQLKKKYSSFIVNTALDISINQYIENLPSWSSTIEKVNLSFNGDLSYERNAEYYAEKIKEAIDKLTSEKGKKKILNKELMINSQDIKIEECKIENAHDVWNLNKNNFDLEHLKELTKKTANNASKGKISSSIQRALKDLNKKAQIPWNEYLRKVIGTQPMGYKKTITRKDRRQPNRLDIRGKLPDHKIKLLIALDISGSMSDEDIQKVMVEIFDIVKKHPAEITIIESDNAIRRVYKVKRKGDIKKKLDTRGGTSFSPVFQHIYDNRLRDHILIYFTDGMGEEELKIKPINYKTLWVLTGSEETLSLKDSFGEIKRLSYKKVKKNDVTLALQDMKEIIKDWACAANQYI